MNVEQEKRTRTQRAVEWAVWHIVELAGVLGPLALGAVFTWWFALVSVVFAAGWGVHELRDHRKLAALQGKAGERRVLVAADVSGGRDESREGA